MKIGTSLALIAVGLILRYAVDFELPGIDVLTLGSILFFVGLLGLAVSIYFEVASSRSHRPRPPRRAPESRAPAPPRRREPAGRPFDPIVPPHEQPRDLPVDRSDDRTRRL